MRNCKCLLGTTLPLVIALLLLSAVSLSAVVIPRRAGAPMGGENSELSADLPLSEPTETEDPNASAVASPRRSGVQNFLLCGKDRASGLYDVIVLAQIDTQNRSASLLQIPRDTFAAYTEGTYRKLNGAGSALGGMKGLAAFLSANLGIPVDHYALVDLDCVSDIVDAIGGVTVYFDRDFNAYGNTPIYAGENYLTGAMALDVARDRDSFSDGDNARGRNQMRIIKAVVQKLASGAIIANYADILASLEGMFVTDITMDDISKLVKMQLSDLASWNIQSYAVTGDGGMENTYTAGEAWVMYPNMDMVAFGKGLIDRVIAGEVLTEQDVVYPG